MFDCLRATLLSWLWTWQKQSVSWSTILVQTNSYQTIFYCDYFLVSIKLTGQVHNIDHLVIIDCSARKPWVLVFTRLPIDTHHSPRHCCRPRTPNHGNSPAILENYSEMVTWSLNSPDPNWIVYLWDVPNKSDPWRPQRGSDLALTRQSMETGPLLVFCVVWIF